MTTPIVLAWSLQSSLEAATLARNSGGLPADYLYVGRSPFQQVTWKSPIFFACDLLNTWIASGVGCNSTLQPFFAK